MEKIYAVVVVLLCASALSVHSLPTEKEYADGVQAQDFPGSIDLSFMENLKNGTLDISNPDVMRISSLLVDKSSSIASSFITTFGKAIISYLNVHAEEIRETINPLINYKDIQPRDLIDTVNDTIQGLLQNEILSNPIEIPGPIPLTFSDSLINGTIEISNTEILGISMMLVPYLTQRGIGINFVFTLPALTIYTDYKADLMLLGILPIYGEAKDINRIQLNDLQLSGYATLNIFTQSIEEFKIVINLANIEVDIKGLLNDEEFSSMASSLIAMLGNDVILPQINTNAEEISGVISEPIKCVLNAILKSTALDDCFK